MTYFSLDRAYLCADCRTVHSSSTQCPACANREGLMNLAGVLDRKPVLAETKAILGMLEEVEREVRA